MRNIDVYLQIEILPNNKIYVPGCEPTSAISSISLMAAQRAQGLCVNTMVNVNDILEAIPGSFIKIGENFGAPLKKWVVLPPYDSNRCPCDEHHDWYGVLRDLARSEDVVESKFDYCNVGSMGYCPDPDFSLTPAPEPDSYFPEGSNQIFQNYTP